VTNEDTAAVLYSGVEQAEAMNVISPTLFSLSDSKGNFSSLADNGYVTQAHEKGLQVWGLVDDFSKKIDLSVILGTTSIRTKLVNGLVGAAIQYDLDGINIDFENVKAENADAFLEFLRELVLKCHANDIIVSVDAYTPANYNAYYDLEEQGRVVDYVILMAYDEHYAGSEESGSVSSLSFVKSGVKSILEEVPAERVVVALPFYTRLWHEKKTKTGTTVTSTAYGMSGAESVLRANDVTAKWDKKTGQYYAKFKGDNGTYKIWLEEETSLKKKLEAVTSNQVAGVAFWKLGFERAATWLMIAEALK
jgi:spore germination protein YaaH